MTPEDRQQDRQARLYRAAHDLLARDAKYIGSHIVLPCADHAEAIRLVRAVRSALAECVHDQRHREMSAISDTMIDAGVAFALNVSVHGEGGWSKYVAELYRTMEVARLRETPPLAIREHTEGWLLSGTPTSDEASE